MITITIEQLKARAQHRPAGYVDDVLSMATRDGDTLRLTPDAWTALRAKYQHATPDETPLLPEIIRRFEICKECEHSIDGHQCDLHKSCCFGHWRSNPENQCPAGLWPAIERPTTAVMSSRAPILSSRAQSRDLIPNPSPGAPP